MRSLRLLDVSSNALTALPPALGRCSALVRLDASRNALTALPAALGQCAELASIEVRLYRH